MISNDLRNLIGSFKAHLDADHLPPAYQKVLLDRLREIADLIAVLEGNVIPPNQRGGWSNPDYENNDGNVVSIRAHVRSKPRVVKSNNGGDAA